MMAGRDAPTHGEGKNSWLTGTAAWTFVNLSQAILGVQPSYDGLSIDPCIPETLSGFTVTRHFRGAVYHIHVDNSAKSQKGIKTLLVNGTPVEGNMIPYQKDVTEYHVSAIM
jgi:cellobiose phosphorylase